MAKLLYENLLLYPTERKCQTLMRKPSRKSELIDLYDKICYSYFDFTMDDLDAELNTYRALKKKYALEQSLYMTQHL